MTGLIASGGQNTPAKALNWRDEPDVFDMLRRLLPGRKQQLGDALLDFAVARAFLGSRSDGRHLPETAHFGDLARVRFEWSIPYASLPRRVAPRGPIEATGASYVWIDTRKADDKAPITLSAQWEESFVFQWAAVRVDAQGRELGRRNAGGVFGQDRVQLSIESVDGSAGLLVVGVHVGADDRSAPFDPDEAPVEAGYELSIYAQ